MDIFINGEQQSVSDGLSAADLIEYLALGDTRVAIEVNQEIVVRSALESHILRDGDQVEVVQAIGGG